MIKEANEVAFVRNNCMENYHKIDVTLSISLKELKLLNYSDEISRWLKNFKSVTLRSVSLRCVSWKKEMTA